MLFSMLILNRWKIALHLLPILLILGMAHFLALPLIQKYAKLQNDFQSLQENKLESQWLDSTENALQKDVALFQKFKFAKIRALNSDSNIQETIDHIRNLAQKTGFDVLKTTPTMIQAEPLNSLKLRIEGPVAYPSLIELFDSLHLNHPDLFLEEMLVKKTSDRSDGKLEAHLTLQIFHPKKFGIP